MPKITAKYCPLLSQYLAIVVILLSVFLSAGAKPGSYYFSFPDAPAIRKTDAKSVISLKQNNFSGKISTASAIKRKISAEAILPAFNLTFHQQVLAFHSPNLGNFLMAQKGDIPSYAARAPGVSLFMRFFSITIQPNAP